MKKALILGSNPGSIEMIKYLKENKYYIIVSDYLPITKSPAKLIADEYWNISTLDIELLYQNCKEKKVDAILTGTGEQNIDSAIKLTKKLGLPFYVTEECWKNTNNKIVFKQYCKIYDLPVPRDYTLDLPPKENDFPIIVKPADNCFNRGLTLCRDISEFEGACQIARDNSPENKIVIEKFIRGRQINAFYHMIGGKVQLSAITESLTNEGFPSCNYTVTLSRGDYTDLYLTLYDEKVKKMLKSLSCTNGTAILQGIACKQQIYFLEINFRLDGLGFYNTLKDAYGIDAVKIIADISTSNKTNHEPVELEKNNSVLSCIYSLWTYKNCRIQKISGIDNIEKTIKNIHIQCRCTEGMEVTASREDGVLLFNLCFYDSNMETIVKDLKLINQMLYVYDEAGVDILEKFNNYKQINYERKHV